MKRAIDLVGEKYGQLTVISREPNQDAKVMWKCVCDCGNEVTVRASSLRCGLTKSCGCYHRVVAKFHSNYKHGGATHVKNREKLYFTWLNMRRRCGKETDKNYKNYGGRGILVCEEWQNDYSLFRKWAYETGYQRHLTLDRIDVNGNYEPSNCRWVDMKTQQNNRRNNRIITYNGEKHTLSEWAEKLGISQRGLMYRLNNWAVKDAIETPVRKSC